MAEEEEIETASESVIEEIKNEKPVPEKKSLKNSK